MARILDGAAIAAAIKQEVAEEVKVLAAKGIKPGLAAVLVGNVAASQIYVRSKVQSCAELGIYSDLITPPETVTTEEMMDLVAALNARDDIDGILIQLPLPKHVDAKALLDAIDPANDSPCHNIFVSNRRDYGNQSCRINQSMLMHKSRHGVGAPAASRGVRPWRKPTRTVARTHRMLRAPGPHRRHQKDQSPAALPSAGRSWRNSRSSSPSPTG